MKHLKLFIFINLIGFSLAACPTGFYEDDCGNCWLPYCYDTQSHEISYDSSESECTGVWVMPGDSGDPFFNNYCEECPNGFYSDDCSNCWMAYCYTLFAPGLNGDGPHSVYYDLSEDECSGYGYGYYPPGATGDPYFNSNCSACPDGEVLDDCGICQAGQDSP